MGAASTRAVRHRAVFAAAAAAALALLQPAAAAEVIDIGWDAAGGFRRTLDIAPGKFAEVCGAQAAGQSVRWRFDASAPLTFNIHYHVGKELRYPARNEQVDHLQGQLLADSAQDYCWMWSNKGAAAVRLNLQLQSR
ncbi:MAG: hypothetical protein OEY03_12230 [Rhizobacter sp.]|nr:hypothetical protein [Rhizobacter sp.]